jgi:hypothetical protein
MAPKVSPATTESDAPKADESAIVVPANGGIVVPTAHPGRISFADMQDKATIVVTGFDLVKGKAALIGVPFACIGVTYRDGISEGDVRRVNYVSVELITADAKTLADRVQRGSIPTPVTVGPEEMLVINDGSTGIARQVTEILHRAGIINVGPITEETGGEMGQSPYDRYRADWVSGQDVAEQGIRGYPLFMAPRGLRVSEYEIPGTKKKAQTYYLG